MMAVSYSEVELTTGRAHTGGARNFIQSRTYISPLNPIPRQFYPHGITSTRLPPVNPTSRPDDFTSPLAHPAKLLAYSPSDEPPPSMSVSQSGDAMSRSRNIPQNDNELVNLGSHSATSGPTVQRRPPYERIAGEAKSDGRSDVAAGAMSAGASGLLARTREPYPADNQTPAISAAVSNHSATVVRSEISVLDISPLGEVSPKVGVPRALAFLTRSPPQPSPRADNTKVIPVCNMFSSGPSGVAHLKGVQVASHEGITNRNRALSTSPVGLSSPSLPPITPPLPQNVPKQPSREADNTSFGPPEAAESGESDRSPSSQVDLLGEGNAMKSHAQQVHRTASVPPLPIPSAHSVPSLNRRGISISSSISRAASILTMIAPSRKGTARGECPVEPAPFELSHPRDDENGKADTNGQKLPSQGRATATPESPSLPLPVFGPHLWDEIYPLIHRNEGVDHEANGTARKPTLDQERKRVAALDECESHGKDIVIPKNPPESPLGRTYSFTHSPRHDANVSHLPETSDPREKLRRTPGSAPSLNRTESLITLPHPVLSPTRKQHDHVTPVPSNDDLTGPNAYTPPESPTVVSDSQARAVLCPGSPVHSDRSLLEGKSETYPDVSLPTEIPLMQRPVPTIIQPTPQEYPSSHPEPSPLGDGDTEPESPGQSGGDRKLGDGRTEDESTREAERESPPQGKHEGQGGVKGLYLRAWKKYSCCC